MTLRALISMGVSRLLARATATLLLTATLVFSGATPGVESVYAEMGAADQAAKADHETVRILALGDSLTAGYGLDDLNDAFPARLEAALKTEGYDVEVLPGGVSGETTAGGRARLDWVLADKPDAVIVELGGNDGLRAIDPDVTYDNLNAILARLEAEGIPALLAGMMAPPNLGRDYTDRFSGAYQRLAEQYDVVFYPFFLEGVAADPSLNQDDRIHPNEKGVTVIVERILPSVESLIDRVLNRAETDPAS